MRRKVDLQEEVCLLGQPWIRLYAGNSGISLEKRFPARHTPGKCCPVRRGIMIRTLLLTAFAARLALRNTRVCRTPQLASTIEACFKLAKRQDRLKCYDDIARAETKDFDPASSTGLTTANPGRQLQHRSGNTIHGSSSGRNAAARARQMQRFLLFRRSASLLRRRSRLQFVEMPDGLCFGRQRNPRPKRSRVSTLVKICDDSKRLYEYDRLAGLNPRPPGKSSYLSKAWLLDDGKPRKGGTLGHPCLPGELLPATRTIPPGQATLRVGQPGHVSTGRRGQVPAQPEDEAPGGYLRSCSDKKVDLWAAIRNFPNGSSDELE